MANDFEQLSSAFAARIRELGVGPADPRVAPLVAQLQALMRERIAQATAGAGVVMRQPSIGEAVPVATGVPEPECSFDLPAALADLLRDYLKTCPPRPFVQVPALAQSDAGRRMLSLEAADRVRIARAAYDAWSSEPWGGLKGSGLRRVVSDLLRGKLPLADADAIALIDAAARHGFVCASYTPNQAVLSMLERHVSTRGLSLGLREKLEGLLAEMTLRGAARNAQGRKLQSGIKRLLVHDRGAASSIAVFEPKPDAWGTAVKAKLAALPADGQTRLGALLVVAEKGGRSAKPAKGWLKGAETALDQPDRNQIGRYLLDLIECHEPGSRIALENQETIRGLLWLAAMAAPDIAARRLEAFAQTCLTFSAMHFAYLSLVLGNAAIHAFVLMPGTAGVGSLSRLRRRLKRPGEIKTVDKALSALAAARGMTTGELEEIGLPDYGFAADGRLEIAVGPATAVLAITDTNTLETTWRGADGTPLKGPPAEVKAGHSDDLKLLRAQAKEIGETLKAQCVRLERLYLDEREWSFGLWTARYLNEPLVARAARRLVWAFRPGDRWVTGLPEADGIFDAAGTRLDVAADDVRVKLWHPMQSEASHVLAWRRRLASLDVTQPFKQAHREIYVLTDAERDDAHPFEPLRRTHRSAAPVPGALSGARLELSCLWQLGSGQHPADQAPAGQRNSILSSGSIRSKISLDQERQQFRHLSTDQVRFTNGEGELVALERVPSILFSELMRDVDLFVSVAGLGNDPTWGDRGTDPYGEYWSAAAFGPLSETAKTRHAVLADLLPGLTIAGRCRLEDRFLVVAGRLRTYRIHLGSANIQMEPNSRYLCIVQDHQNAGARVRLPFEGDATLALILSKAFLLADDDKIKDPTILSQIKVGG